MEISNTKMNNSFSVIFTTRKTRTTNDEKVIIYVRITLNSQRVEMSTGLKIEENKWCEITKRARGSSEQSKAINSCLGDINNNIYQVYAMLLGNGQTLKEWTSQADEPINPICICSDPEKTKKIGLLNNYKMY